MNARNPLLAAFLLSIVPAAAAESPGALVVDRGGGTPVAMPLEHTKVSIEVSAFVARATVEQTFRNPFEDPVNATYTFPLGDRAAVDDFEILVGDRVVRGEIRRREDARREYERARGEGYQAALLEQERPNLFTQSVANLLPGEPIVVRLRTVETLAYERGTYRLTFPLVVGPRYVPGGGRVPDAGQVSPPVLKPGTRSGHDVEIAVSIDAGVPIGTVESPSHRIGVVRPSAGRATVALADADTIPDKDFLLRWSVASDDPAVGVLAHRDGVDGFFTLLVQPRAEVSAVEAAPKEITFVVDTSGSMQGVPIEASKRFIQQALRELGPRDTFNLVRFAGDNTVFSKEPRPNSRADVEDAIAWLSALRGGGGTELLAAMRAAFARPADPKRLRIVIFATDGYVGNEPEILAAIGGVLGDARIYCVGIGSSVNHYLLDRMADLGRGAYVFVRPDEKADDALAAFRSWVTRPYMTDLEIDWGGLPIADVMPTKPRDLFSGQTLTVVGRYLGASSGDVVVRGKLAGVRWERRLRIDLPERAPRHEALGSLWARRRVEELMLESPDAVPESIRAEVTALALEHRILTAYTSFLAVDTARLANPGGSSTTVRQALPIPEHVPFEGIFGEAGPEARDAVPEDHVQDPRHGVVGGVVAGVIGGVAVEEIEIVTTGAGSEFGRARGAFAKVAGEPAPRAPRVYQATLNLPPAKGRPDGDGNPNVLGPRVGDFRAEDAGVSNADPLTGSWLSRVNADTVEEVEVVSSSPRTSRRLRDAALRVLADLADDGRLSPSGGRPSLAALLAAQRKGGAISDDVTVHALATWALAEAAVRGKDEPWLLRAAKDAAAHLERVAKDADDEGKRWSRLALSVAAPGAVRPAASDVAISAEWKQLATALQAAPAPGARLSGGEPFARLCANARRGHLLATAASVR
jgi:Ca-activated chloride channel family protein